MQNNKSKKYYAQQYTFAFVQQMQASASAVAQSYVAASAQLVRTFNTMQHANCTNTQLHVQLAHYASAHNCTLAHAAKRYNSYIRYCVTCTCAACTALVRTARKQRKAVRTF